MLRTVKLLVTSILTSDEFGMIALFGNLPILNHDDAVGIRDCRKSMRNHQRGAACEAGWSEAGRNILKITFIGK